MLKHFALTAALILILSHNALAEEGSEGTQGGAASGCRVKSDCAGEIKPVLKKCFIEKRDTSPQRNAADNREILRQCKAEVRPQYNACVKKFDDLIAQCEAKAKAEAEKKIEAEKKMEEAARKQEEGERTLNEGNKKITDGMKIIEAGDKKAENNQDASQEYQKGGQMFDQGSRMATEGDKKFKQGMDEFADGSQRQQTAEQNEAAARKLIQQLISNRKKSTGDFDKLTDTLTTAEANNDAIVDKNLPVSGDLDAPRQAVDTGGSPKAPKNDAGGGSPGGGSPTSNQQADSNQKSQDQNGGGGGGMPSFGGGSGSSPATTAAVEPKQDCSNPTFASSNPVCTCRLNPTDSRCAKILADEKNSVTAKKAAKMYDGDAGGGAGMPNTPGGFKDAKEKNISQHGQMAQGAGGSVGKGVGSGVGSKEANDPREAQQKSYRDQYGNGKRGGSMYSGGGSGGGFGGSSSSGAGAPNNRIPSTFAKANVGNKRQAIAGMSRADELKAQMQARFNNQRRNPTSAIGPDGITGPHTDQFKKIRMRYSELLGL